MTKIKKRFIWAGTCSLLILGLLAYSMLSMMKAPLYKPGKLSEKANAQLIIPKYYSLTREGEDYWHVEDGIELFHQRYGEGRNVLVVHGGPGMPYRNHWQGLKPLNEYFQFHYYDQRGSGKSTRPITTFEGTNYYQNIKSADAQLGIAAQLLDIERIRRILGDEKLIIIGHSYGAFLASLYASEFPQQVEALVLVSPADMLLLPQKGNDLFADVGNNLPGNLKNEFDTFMKSYFDFSNVFEKSDDDLVQQNIDFAKFYLAAESEFSRASSKISNAILAKPGGWMVTAMYFSMGQKHDYRGALKTIEAPALIIHGEEDLQNISVSEMYEVALTNAEIKSIVNASHFSYNENSLEFSSHIRQFLSPFSKSQ